MTTRTRVVWTDSEKQMLIDIVVALRAADPELSKLAAFREAQDQLAKSGVLANRTRSITTLITFPWFDELLAATVIRVAKEQREAEEKRLAEVEAQRLQEQAVMEQTLANLNKVPVTNLVQALMSRLSEPGTSLADLFAPIVQSVVTAVKDDVVTALTPVVERVAARAVAGQGLKQLPTGCQRRPRVIVIGLKGSQPQSIKRKFGESLDITFFESSVPSSQLKANLKHADHVFFMSGWNSHSVQDILRNSNVPFDYVSGTNSNLDNCMSTFLQRAGAMQ